MNKINFAFATLIMPLMAFADNVSLKDAAENAHHPVHMHTDKTLVAFGVPVAFFIFILGIIFVAHYLRYRQAKEVQETIRLMVEKGASVPPELLIPVGRKSPPTYAKDMRTGLVLTFLGIAIPTAMYISSPADKDWVWGIIPFAIGIAYLISAQFTKNAINNG